MKDVFQKLKSGGKLFVTAPAEVGAAPQFTVMLKSTSIGQNDVSMELMLAGFEDVDAKTEPQPHVRIFPLLAASCPSLSMFSDRGCEAQLDCGC